MHEGDAVVSSPPYENSLSSASNGIDETKYKGSRGGPHAQGHIAQQYSPDADNLGNAEADTFWSAACTILQETYAVLKPGAVACWVVKSYVRAGKVIDFPAQWRALCESVGFETIEEIHAHLIEHRGTQFNMEGEMVEKNVKRSSFFRRLYEAKHPENAIDWETVYLMRKPLTHTAKSDIIGVVENPTNTGGLSDYQTKET
jgi:hypothetical protein